MMMTPIKFLWYSLIGAADLFFLLAWFSALRTQMLDLYRRAVRVKYEERKAFLESLDPSASEAYKIMN